jgi:hypothetical protein
MSQRKELHEYPSFDIVPGGRDAQDCGHGWRSRSGANKGRCVFCGVPLDPDDPTKALAP